MVKVFICIILILLLILYINKSHLRKYFERFQEQVPVPSTTCLKKPPSNSEVFRSSMHNKNQETLKVECHKNHGSLNNYPF